MKIKKTILIYLFFTLPVAFGADVQGTWLVETRICSDGKPAADKFKVGVDTMKLMIGEHRVRLSIYISCDGTEANCKDGIAASSVAGMIRPNTILFFADKNTGGQSERVPYKFNESESTLTIITSGYGPGGSCAVGSLMATKFRRAQ